MTCAFVIYVSYVLHTFVHIYLIFILYFLENVDFDLRVPREPYKVRAFRLLARADLKHAAGMILSFLSSLGSPSSDEDRVALSRTAQMRSKLQVDHGPQGKNHRFPEEHMQYNYEHHIS